MLVIVNLPTFPPAKTLKRLIRQSFTLVLAAVGAQTEYFCCYWTLRTWLTEIIRLDLYIITLVVLTLSAISIHNQNYLYAAAENKFS